MMQAVKSLTQLESVDGFRFNASIQPLDALRASGTWNYAILTNKRHFDLCMSLFNPAQEDSILYKDFLTTEFSGLRGITAIGSFIPVPKFGIMVKGEGNWRDVKDTKDGNYMIELRKMLGSMHVGIFKKDDSFGLNYLHRTTPSFSHGIQLGLTVLLFL